MKNKILMDENKSSGDTRYVISKFLIFFRILQIALAFCYLQIFLSGQKIFAIYMIYFKIRKT